MGQMEILLVFQDGMGREGNWRFLVSQAWVETDDISLHAFPGRLVCRYTCLINFIPVDLHAYYISEDIISFKGLYILKL